MSIIEFSNIFIDRQSFENVSKWVKDVRDERGDDAIIALVGNKTDLDEDGMR